MTRSKFFGLLLSATAATLVAAPASADRIKHPTAIFSGLDKITGRIISFEVATDETVQFGSLQITERACYTRPSTEAPQTITFVQVDEVDAKKQYKRIFSGWMFAASPGLHGIEHPVYDIWLTDCKGGTEVIAAPPETAEAEPAPPANATKEPVKAPKPRRAEAAKRDQQRDDGTIDVGAAPGAAPRRDPNRAPPARSFFPDEAGGRDPGGFY
ncbi:DUF2155 domain-containing protein [Beijerinckia sp. L45]|uniref:DUF2155 domain-containing protein n=1 Tax=Beijerinckia sp. L45 TaxID=1641855 RepID=UPI00131CE4AA|nr:DUF2155 domain-containing protein [Beijerinckia sp. L45]